jgi:hypothetical protein
MINSDYDHLRPSIHGIELYTDYINCGSSWDRQKRTWDRNKPAFTFVKLGRAATSHVFATGNAKETIPENHGSTLVFSLETQSITPPSSTIGSQSRNENLRSTLPTRKPRKFVHDDHT